MSITIIGGHDRMVRDYKEVCKEYNFKPKVFTQPSGNLCKKIGNPDILVLFTNTVCHKMVKVALEATSVNSTTVIRCHNSTKRALEEILSQHTA